MGETRSTRRILVTGANKGIGLALVTAILAEHEDSVVLLGSRDAERGAAARDELVAAHPGWADRVEVLPIDVSRDASVAQAAAGLRGRFEGESTPLYAVTNNAGIGLGNGKLRQVLEVNTRGIRRVCEAFLPLIREGGRIVNITSASGPSFVSACSEARQRQLVDPAITLEALDALEEECLACDGAAAFAAHGLANGEPYGLSKALANAYTLVLARQFPTLRINACTPGFIATDLTRPFADASGKTPEAMGMKSPAEGTRAPMFLLFGDPEGSGRYYGSDAQRSPLDRYRAPGSPAFSGA